MKKASLGQIVGKLGTAGYEVCYHMVVKSKQHMVASLNTPWAILVSILLG